MATDDRSGDPDGEMAKKFEEADGGERLKKVEGEVTEKERKRVDGEQRTGDKEVLESGGGGKRHG